MAEIPMGRPGEPSEVASVALFYASPLSSYMTGTVAEVAGGAIHVCNLLDRDVVICEPVRTPIGRYGGMFKDLSAVDLGVAAVRGLIARTALDLDRVDTSYSATAIRQLKHLRSVD
jgi:hypothetical protein